MHLKYNTSLICLSSEGDPLVHWSGEKWWRADVTYAAMVAKVMNAKTNYSNMNIGEVQEFFCEIAFQCGKQTFVFVWVQYYLPALI